MKPINILCRGILEIGCRVTDSDGNQGRVKSIEPGLPTKYLVDMDHGFRRLYQSQFLKRID